MFIDQIIDEAYFGKSKNLLAMEEVIGKIRTKYKGNELNKFIGGRGVFEHIEDDPLWIEWKELFEKQFGFYSVSLMLMRSTIPNACTIPITVTLDGAFKAKEAFMVDNTGFKYKPEYKYCTIIIISEGLLFDDNYTDGEIVAVMLHEVGHNFDSTCYSHLPPLTALQLAILFPLYILQQILLGNINEALQNILFMITCATTTRRITTKITNSAINCKLWMAFDLFKFLMAIPSDIITRILLPFFKIKTSIIAAITVSAAPFIGFLTTAIGYSRENFSDKFASIHGYGPELTSALTKLTEPLGSELIINEIPIVGHLYGLYGIFAQSIIAFVEPHPIIAARIESAVSVIEKDLTNSKVDKKTKDQIRADIKQIRGDTEKYREALQQSNGRYYEKVDAKYQDYLAKAYPGYGDIRGTIIGKDYGTDDAIDNAIANVKIR